MPDAVLRSSFCRTLFGAFITLISLNIYGNGEQAEAAKAGKCAAIPQYVFGWQFVDEPCNFKPRGGTSTGNSTTKDLTPSPHWLKLQSEDKDKFERDRQAILAMSGYFRVGFDFIETMGFTENYTPAAPYRSWGTEMVIVVDNEPEFISLQHIMVMYFVGEDGTISEPMVMKHWRQDWEYEKPSEFVYTGNNVWRKHELTGQDIEGTWSQSVYQVDDSPRYESHGKWQHKGNRSEWISELTWRPLPRRESSVRQDYQILEGINKHIILPDGWVQEEENYKLVINETGKPASQAPYLAKELGIARYERIKDHDFTPGEAYWEATSSFWRNVREVWSSLIADNTSIEINKQADGKFMFMPFFDYAQSVSESAPVDPSTEQQKIRNMLAPFTEPAR